MFKKFKLKNKLIAMTVGLLFISCAVILVVGLTSLRKAIYTEKETQTREFVNLGLAVLENYHALEASGVLEREEAQQRAKEIIQCMKFGERNLDYYWINDFHPRMIMHPFRPDLAGQDISGIRDPDGFDLFVEMVKVCREKGKGYVPYKWQYYDDTTRIEPKLSYVAEFKPWQWIIGTGVYLNDVNSTVNMVAGTLLLISVVAILLAAIISFFFSRNISLVLSRISNALGAGAEQVASASSQVSSASQSLAEGASEQAAGIEETSSSLEEMASMTKQNASNAGHADTLMNEAKQVVGQANEFMNRLSGSMEDITKASEETSKIVKTIDEIAFQTNLLALNAAVEAARAGEAGAGFAVVADEVRNLALRAAEAAKNTSNLIEGTVKKVKDGAQITAQTSQAFIQVTGSAVKVAELVGEISAASNEQAQGIDQINKAVTEMDKVIQQNAANAEESASASEELNAQAEEMKAMVHELETLVEGAAASTYAVSLASPKKQVHRVAARVPERAKALTASRAQVPAMAKRKVRPEQVIPMGEDELKNF